MYQLTETIHEAHESLTSHRHERAYIAIPLEGRYEELSVDGCFVCAPGVAVIHGEWHIHADRFGAAHGHVLNIALPRGSVPPCRGSSLVTLDVVEIEKLARRDAADAAGAVLEVWRGSASDHDPAPDWIGAFLQKMRCSPGTRIGSFANDAGVSREHVARRIKARLGVAPSVLRSEWRFRVAAELLARGDSLASVSASAGYADQSHMTRDVKARSGTTPAALRARWFGA